MSRGIIVTDIFLGAWSYLWILPMSFMCAELVGMNFFLAWCLSMCLWHLPNIVRYCKSRSDAEYKEFIRELNKFEDKK